MFFWSKLNVLKITLAYKKYRELLTKLTFNFKKIWLSSPNVKTNFFLDYTLPYPFDYLNLWEFDDNLFHVTRCVFKIGILVGLYLHTLSSLTVYFKFLSFFFNQKIWTYCDYYYFKICLITIQCSVNV